MPEKQYEFPLPPGTVIEGGDMKDGRAGEHYQYHIEEVLGQGGFGITYKVWAIIRYGQIEMKAWFAIKEHFVRGRCHRAADGKTVEYSIEAKEDVEDSLKDFIKEGRLLHQICHVKNPNDKQNDGWRHVVPVNEVIETNNTAYFVMQYLDGGSIKSKAPMGEEQALSYMRPICQAVAYIHRHGILHMDIKPENIVMRRDLKTQYEEPVLIDFGVSLHFDRKGNLTTTHTSFGRTDGYSPIEQYGAVTDFQPKIDVYALGATLFYLLTGTVPPMSLILERAQLESMLPENLSQRTRAALLHAMTKEPSRRTPSASRFIEELEDSISLPRGFKLVSPHGTFLITDVREVTPDYILYDAVPYQDNASSDGDNVTKVFQYQVLERFVKGLSKRRSDNTVVHANDGDGMSSFWEQATKTMELSEVGQTVQHGNHLERETFEANGTTYAICDTRFRPESNASKAIRRMKQSASATAASATEGLANGWQKAKKPLMWTALAALVIGALILLAPTLKGLFESSGSSQDEEMAAADTTAVADSAALPDEAEIAVEEAEKKEAAEPAPVTPTTTEATEEQKRQEQLKQEQQRKEQEKQEKERQEKERQRQEQQRQEQQRQEQQRQQQRQAQDAASQQKDAAAQAVKYVNMEGADNSAKALQYALKADASTRASVISKLKAKGYAPAMKY